MEAIGLYTNQTMILTDVTAGNAEEVIRLLAGKAMENGLIEEEFITAVLAREKEYPTGLPTAVPIAIPHIHDGCLKSFFSMAVLKNPVSFRCMGDPDETVEALLVFLFGITDPSYQTAVLKKFSTIFQDEETLEKLKNVTDAEELMNQMKGLLDEYLVTD
ncbi:PTS sugar transporter subunit IIA [Mediterraneibacter sp. NSJ-55]|uniref:PTS sugar transporter subunit IIA n=1 Tax=Mediterraneibacter hominis TaxID=2763054 RepID=A0A923RS24_9FIRM|nr:PTS sugar transporter subunit IIA [Mediterraneibacter hominis]MBC5690333.1 PTS sugar transporter subunit IIA [Mediterraneibacter hominis]